MIERRRIQVSQIGGQILVLVALLVSTVLHFQQCRAREEEEEEEGKRKRMWKRRRGRKFALKGPAICPWLHQSAQRFTRICEMEETRYELHFLSDLTTKWDYTDSIYLCNEKSLLAVSVCANLG